MWNWAIWGALAFAVLATSGAAILLALRALRAWRNLKVVRGGFVGRLDELAVAGAATAEKAAAAGDTLELQESVARLRVSLARLSILRDALDEAGDTFGRVTAILPHK
jgi:hypothetical protein